MKLQDSQNNDDILTYVFLYHWLKNGVSLNLWKGFGSSGNLRNDGIDSSEVVFLLQDEIEAQTEDGNHVQTEGGEEHEEISVVPPPDAVVDPRAMMVECLKETTQKWK